MGEDIHVEWGFVTTHGSADPTCAAERELFDVKLITTNSTKGSSYSHTLLYICTIVQQNFNLLQIFQPMIPVQYFDWLLDLQKSGILTKGTKGNQMVPS